MKKRSKKTTSDAVVTFDFAARREFVTGVSKRKEQRRNEAKIRAIERQKEERRRLRAERREKIREHITHVRHSQLLAESAATPTLEGGLRTLVSQTKGSSSSSKRHRNAAGSATSCYVSVGVENNAEAQLSQDHAVEPMQNVRLLPPSAEEAAASPWQIASCVSLSVGGFMEHLKSSENQETQLSQPSASTVLKGANAGSSSSRSGMPQTTPEGKTRPFRTTRPLRRNRQKHLRKRHKSRKPQRKGSSRK
uniref:Nucleolar protein 12 n=1 Tax=Eimeria tenella TaxID=5802 RepID=H9B9M7_EIMTE|nr:hypothetical protein [Eimeria tenella]